MSKLIWDKLDERRFETGVSNGVLYKNPKTITDSAKAYSEASVFNGLTSVDEAPTGAEATPLYADNIKYFNLKSAEEFAATLNAYTYPDAFASCLGYAEPTPGVIVGQQNRDSFGLSYRTRLGDAVVGDSLGYKIHLVYGCDAGVSQKTYETVNNTPNAITFSWPITTTAVEMSGMRPTATLEIVSTNVDPDKLQALEDILYGTDTIEARLPLPDEVASVIGEEIAAG